MSIQYVQGDATVPVGSPPQCIVHICNDEGGWGRGFVLALSARWKTPEQVYRAWYRGRKSNDFGLGAVCFVPVSAGLWVANMVGQHGTQATTAGPPIRYPAVEAGLGKVAQFARQYGASLHMPRIGCGLAGGTWDRIEPLLLQQLDGLPVTVYDR